MFCVSMVDWILRMFRREFLLLFDALFADVKTEENANVQNFILILSFESC